MAGHLQESCIVRKSMTGIAALALIVCLHGCAPEGSGPPMTDADGDRVIPGIEEGVQPEWPFWSNSMRVHPASRLVLDQATGQAYLEARMEFMDVLGHTSKAVGVMRFDLVVAGLPSNVSNPVLSWELPMRTLDENALHYDDVTRTYRFRLSMGEWSSSPDVTLTATFESIDGRRFDASQRFR